MNSGAGLASGLAPFSRSYIFLFVFFFLCGLTTRHLALRRFLFVLVGYTLLHVIIRTTTGLRNEEWQIGTLLAIELFTASDYLLITDDVQQLQLRGQEGPPISSQPWLSRLKWAVHLTLSPRGIGWKHEPTFALPAHPSSSSSSPLSRKSFILSQTRFIVLFSLLFLGMGYLNRANPVFAIGSPELGAYGWAWRLYSVVSFALPIYAYINFQNRMYNVVLVATGISSPSECLPIFGAWKDAYTVRRFWGRTWHQIFRRFGASHGQFLAHRVLKFRKGTFGSSYTQLFTAFVISGIIHQFGEYMLTRDLAGLFPLPLTLPQRALEAPEASNGTLLSPSLIPTPGRGAAGLVLGGGGSFWFFFLQAVAITFEDFVLGAAECWKLASSRNPCWKFVGYLWVLGWLTLTVPLWLNGVVAAGLMDEKHQGGMTLEFVSLAILWRGKKNI